MGLLVVNVIWLVLYTVGIITPQQKEKKPHIKKPLNAFMLFMKEKRAEVIKECTLKESAAINQILGKMVRRNVACMSIQGRPGQVNASCMCARPCWPRCFKMDYCIRIIILLVNRKFKKNIF